MDKKKTVAVLSLIIVIGVFGFYFYNWDKTIKNFDFVYYFRSSSSGGDKVYNITYSVRNGTITSCKGNYSYFGTRETKTESCTVTKLKNNLSPFHFGKIKTEYSKGEKMNEEVIDPPLKYRWQIIPK